MQFSSQGGVTMTFHELTRMMLTSMDFFELRRTAGRYNVPFQGVRRQKLIRDIERKILLKSLPTTGAMPMNVAVTTVAAQSPEGAVSARPKITPDVKRSGINTFSARSTISRAESVK